MREIKFRAWDTKNKKWVNSKKYAITFIGEIVDEVQSYDFELMQYTGLKDKNGKEIYEGDIVRGDGVEKVQAEVDWVNIGFGLFPMDNASFAECRIVDDWSNELGAGYKEDKVYWLEIIGNIYENPELKK